LSDLFADALRRETRDQIVSAAGTEAHQDLNGFALIEIRHRICVGCLGRGHCSNRKWARYRAS